MPSIHISLQTQNSAISQSSSNKNQGHRARGHKVTKAHKTRSTLTKVEQERLEHKTRSTLVA